MHKYYCKNCSSYGTLEAQRGYAGRSRAQVTHGVLEQVSLRGIEGIFGLSRRTVEFTTNLLPKWDIQRTDLIGQVAFCLGDHLDG